MQNFELRRTEFKEFDIEAAAKLRLPKPHLPTDKDRGCVQHPSPRRPGSPSSGTGGRPAPAPTAPTMARATTAASCPRLRGAAARTTHVATAEAWVSRSSNFVHLLFFTNFNSCLRTLGYDFAGNSCEIIFGGIFGNNTWEISGSVNIEHIKNLLQFLSKGDVKIKSFLIKREELKFAHVAFISYIWFKKQQGVWQFW